MSTTHCSLLSLGCAFGFAPPPNQTAFTALRALKIAQRRLRPDVRSKLLSVSSSKTGDSLMPDAWRFVFLDPGTSGKCRVVTVAEKASSEHPDTVEAFNGMKPENVSGVHPVSQNKLLHDSDRILALARGAEKLKGITAAEYRLGQQRSGQEPMWTVIFYGNADSEAMVRFQIGAKTGTVKILPNE